MAPELAAAYVIGWIPSASLSVAQAYLYNRKTKRTESRQLQANLSKVHSYWAESQGKVVSLDEGSPNRDRQIFYRSLLVMGALFLFLSWLGVFFHLLVMTSMYLLAISRFEEKIFSSELVKKDLDEKTVAELLQEISATSV